MGELMKFDNKIFNAEAFAHYVNRVPNLTRNELAKCGAVGTHAAAAAALGNQTGALYCRVPYFGLIDGSTSQNNDGSTDIQSTSTTTYEQGFIAARRMDGWTERSFSKSITAGVDFMDNVAAQIAEYKWEVKQKMLLDVLDGVFSMKPGADVAGTAAKDFLAKHVYDISSETGDDAKMGAATLNKAIQRAGGDNKNVYRLVIMHSEVATNLENMKLLKYMTYNDGNGIERELSLATWNGRVVLIDDNMPTKSGSRNAKTGEAETIYTTYVLGMNSIFLGNLPEEHPYEMARDPKVNGGMDTLYVRDAFYIGVEGISFEKPASITASASNADLRNGDNWKIINDGKKAIDIKSIALCKILSKG